MKFLTQVEDINLQNLNRIKKNLFLL